MPAWQGSTRRDRLPPDWSRIRKRVLRRDDHECRWRMPSGRMCLATANQVDHIKAGDDHREANLQALCAYHHAKKSAGEGAQLSAAKRREIKARFQRHEDHPGLL